MSRVPLLVIVSAAGFAGGWLIGAPPDDGGVGFTRSSIAAPKATAGTIKSAPASAPPLPGDYDVADPSTTLRRILEPDDGLNEFRVRELVRRMPHGEPAWRVPALIDGFRDHAWIARNLMAGWADADPRGAMTWLESQPGNRLRLWQDAVITGWARHNAEAAFAWVKAQPPHTAAAVLRTALIDAVSATAPERALEMLRETGWDASDPRAAQRVWRNWAASDPSAAMAALRARFPGDAAEGQSSLAVEQIAAFGQGLRTLEAAGAARFFASLSDADFDTAFGASAHFVMQEFPASRVEWMERAEGTSAGWAGIEKWSRRFPAEALRTAEELTSQGAQQRVREAVLGEYFRHSTGRYGDEDEEILRRAFAAVTTYVRANAMEAVARKPQYFPTAFAAEIWQSLDGATQQRVGPNFFAGFTPGNLTPASQLLSSAPPEVRNPATSQYCMVLAATEPARAWDAAMSLPEGLLRNVAVASTLAGWAAEDFAAASARLRSSGAALDLDAVSQALGEVGIFTRMENNPGLSQGPEELAVAPLRAIIREMTGGNVSE